MTPQGQRVFDCRPSDAIAIALRSSTAAPLLIDAKILDVLVAYASAKESATTSPPRRSLAFSSEMRSSRAITM